MFRPDSGWTSCRSCSLVTHFHCHLANYTLARTGVPPSTLSIYPVVQCTLFLSSNIESSESLRPLSPLDHLRSNTSLVPLFCYGLQAVGLALTDRKVLLTLCSGLCPYFLELSRSDFRLSLFEAPFVIPIYISDSTPPVLTSDHTHLVVLVTLALTPQRSTSEHSGLNF